MLTRVTLSVFPFCCVANYEVLPLSATPYDEVSICWTVEPISIGALFFFLFVFQNHITVLFN